VVHPKVNIISADILIRGNLTVFVIVINGRCPAREYLEALQENEEKKVWALLKRSATQGKPPPNPERFDQLEGPLYEFKSHQHRLPCFHDGQGRIVITHGFRKKKDRTRRQEIDRAARLRTDYLASKPKQERTK